MSEKEDGSSNPSALEDLDKRLRAARGPEEGSGPQDPALRGTAMGLAFRLSTELVAGLVVGGFIGWALDRWLDTTPVFLLVFFFLGMAAGIRNVVRTSQEMNAPQNENNEAETPQEK